MNPEKKIFIVRSRHHVPESKEGDDGYAVTTRQLDVARAVMQQLVVGEGVERIFFDGMNAREADTWNQLISLGLTDYLCVKAQMARTGLTEDQNDHFRWIETMRDLGGTTSSVRFCETEPMNKRGDPSDFVGPMLIPGALPIKIQTNFWLQMIGRLFGRKIQPIRGLGTYLRDRDAFPLICAHAGPVNGLYAGSDHQYPDLFQRKSGFQVAAVTLKDDLDFQISSANTTSEMPDRLAQLVRNSIEQNREGSTRLPVLS